VTVGVFSFGGGLVGTLRNGVLTDGDVQKQWSSLGIMPANHPRVLVVPVNGASTTPDPADAGYTLENTIDVETIGAMCPIPSLTIILYIANPWDNFPVVLNAAMNPTMVGGFSYTPSIISCSWGAPEIYYDAESLNSINAMLKEAARRGITITAATGDKGSSNGTAITVADFPSSSPYVVACGGTTLRCPNGVYDKNTVETTWSNGGGGFSNIFDKPAYQQALPGTKRSTPDIALVADPSTGIEFTFNGVPGVVVGGTSIVAPTIAGFAAAINLKQALTPLLYTYPSSVFHDITVGTIGAYVAGAGYDNCTGLGSIVGSALVSNINTPTIRVTGVTLTGAPIVSIGQSMQLTAIITPTNASNKTLTYLSSNSNIATVSASGLVTGQTAGTTVITVTTDDGKFTKTLSIIVTPITVTGVVISGTSSIAVGGTTQLTATVQPVTATNKSVTFTSSNPAIATVSTVGIVRGISAGSVIITATTVDGGKVSGFPIDVVHIPVTDVLLTGGGSITVGKMVQLSTTIVPSHAVNQAVSYSSSNSAVATVSSRGVVTAIALGSATITVTTADGGRKSTVVINVIQSKVTGVLLSAKNLIVRVRGQTTLVATVIPLNAANRAVTWTSANPRIATVQNGRISAMAPGRTQIIATTVDGRFAAICNIAVA
jgi:uncharacterized protein YjdB